MLTANFLGKVKKRLFATAYSRIREEQFMLSLARAFFQIMSAHKEKDLLVTAYADRALFNLTEPLRDIGFIWQDAYHTFFGGEENDHFHPYNALESLDEFDFDAVLGPVGLDLLFFSKAVKKAMKEVSYKNFQTCLNPHKIFLLAALVCLIPDRSTILEVGSYQCGTTILMAKLCKILGKSVKIYACDTFGGMPAATNHDRADPLFYDTGLFTDNPLEEVQKRVNKQGVQDYIELVKGDVMITLPQLTLSNVSLVFLDTDQYKGTKCGFDFVAQLSTTPHIIVDDTSLSSVSRAIDEFVAQKPSYRRKNLLTNFDYVVPHIAP